ncbi:hypothetical protein PRZ48_000126 [Zasmidium cellare]|uniref:Uncharacterized protein n=1 Tax=Zasmidium cellare TaxID=395010 RepID=A0ABR0EZ02_ZASCE|nr:hypothetical protein PRZ48_000126 [Zasmidium cellare]
MTYALVDGEDPLNHFGVMGWCDRNIDGFALLPPAEKHSLASQLQVKVALLQRDTLDSEELENDSEGGVTLDSTPEVADLTSNKAEQEPLGKKKKPKLPVVNHVTESINDIASRIVQADLDLQHPNHSLIIWAWCVFNVSGFVESHPNIRKEILQAVNEHLVNGDVILEDSAVALSSSEPESLEARAKRKTKEKKEKRYNQVNEPAARIADRFPHRQVDFSHVNRITAWCVLHVDGFVESGVIPRRQISTKVQEVLEKRYGAYEGGDGD